MILHRGKALTAADLREAMEKVLDRLRDKARVLADARRRAK